MNKQKVLFLITKSTLGGAQRYIYDIATNLNNEKYESVVALGGDGELIQMLEDKNIQVIKIPGLRRNISLLSEITSFFQIAKIIRKEKPDVLHVNSSKAGGIGTFLGRILFVPHVIFTSHGWAFNEDRPSWQKVIIKFFHWLTIFFSHKTIAVSHGLKKQMNWPFVQKKMVVVHLGRDGINMKYREEARSIIETKITGKVSLTDFHADFWMGTIAELHPIKRLNRAIDSMATLTKEFPNLRFVVIHDGQEREKLEQQVADLGLENHVFFTGMIPDAAQLLPALDLFVLPSSSEAFGYVLIEAGLASLPVVATNVGGIPDIITDRENGLLVESNNTPALTSAIQTLVRDSELRHQLAQTHHERAKEFTLEKMIEKTIQEYKE